MKRDGFITVRLPEEMKQKIQKIAQEKMWTLSQTIYVILCDYFGDAEDGEQ